jgi:hypothetical protein
MSVITEFTGELARGSPQNVEQVLKNEITRDSREALDAVLLDATGGTAIRPAGIRFGIAGLTPATAGAQAMVADVKALVGAVQPASRVALLANPVQAAGLASLYTASESFLWITAASVPVGTVVAIDLDSFVSSSGVPEFDLSGEVVLHEEDTAPLPIAAPGPVLAAPTRSTWQTDTSAIRLIWPVTWSLRRSGAVAWMASVTW